VPLEEQPERDEADHRPVAPDVDPVRHRDDRVHVHHQRLQPGLDPEPHLTLEVYDPVGMLQGDIDVTLGRAAHGEVGEVPAEHHPGLAHEHHAPALRAPERHAGGHSHDRQQRRKYEWAVPGHPG
jgi:hypothetical protein